MKAYAYHSDPDYHRSFKGRYLYIYRGKGVLEFSKKELSYWTENFTLKILKNQIGSIELCAFQRIQKLIRLHYLDVEFQTKENARQHIYLVPLAPSSSRWNPPVWKTNAVVQNWYTERNNWVAEQQH